MLLRSTGEIRAGSPVGHHRAALRSLAGSISTKAVMMVALGTSVAVTGADWYFLPGLACVFLLMLVLEYRQGLRQSSLGA